MKKLFLTIVFLFPFVSFADIAPQFMAYQGSDLSVTSGTATLLPIDTFYTTFPSTSSSFSTSTYKFQPTISGWYLFIGKARCISDNVVPIGEVRIQFRLNGSNLSGNFSLNSSENLAAGGGNFLDAVGNSFYYLNGTTDYVQMYGGCTETGATAGFPKIQAGVTQTYFGASYIPSITPTILGTATSALAVDSSNTDLFYGIVIFFISMWSIIWFFKRKL